MSREVTAIMLADIKRLKESPEYQQHYHAAVEALRRCGVIPFLRKYCKPVLHDFGKDVQQTAAAAAFSAGLHEALDQVEYFDEIYTVKEADLKKLSMDFGGSNLARSRGHITDKDK